MACHQRLTGYLTIEYTYHTTDNYEGERPIRPDTVPRQNDLGDQALAIRNPILCRPTVCQLHAIYQTFPHRYIWSANRTYLGHPIILAFPIILALR